MKSVILLVVIAHMLLSCSPNKIITSSVNSNEISEMAYFEPISEIKLIQKGNKILPSDSLSLVSSRYLDSIIKSSGNRYRVSDKVVITDTIIREKVSEELWLLVDQVYKTKKPGNVKLTKTIDSLMTIKNTRFAMATITIGFDRIKGNYGGQVAKGVAVGVLTLGLFAPIPIKSNLTIHTVILDGKNKNIAFYRQSPLKEKSPTDPEVLVGELDWVFKGFLHSNLK